MAYITKRKNTFQVDIAKKNIKDTVEYCPKCYTDGKEIERYVNIVYYQCNKCGFKWGLSTLAKKSKKTKNKESGIMVRDKSNKTTKDNKKKNKEKPMQVNTDIDGTEKFILDAKEKENLIEFDYITVDNKREKLVRPMRVESRNNEKCMMCYCLDDDGIRLFKLEFMHNVRIATE